MAKPCLLVKKSVLNCRTTELKVLCRSLGSIGPLSSLRRTPLSTGPSQMRSTSWTSSVSNTRKWSLDREKRQVVTPGPTIFSPRISDQEMSQPRKIYRRRGGIVWKHPHASGWLAPSTGAPSSGDKGERVWIL